MDKKYFDFDEVNQLIPQLEYHFRALLDHKKELARTSLDLRKLGVTPQLIGRVPNEARPEIHQLQASARMHYREFKQHIFAIENLGGEIKDLELGRVDFPARKNEEEFVYTWQLGVTDVVFPQEATEGSEKPSDSNSDAEEVPSTHPV